MGIPLTTTKNSQASLPSYSLSQLQHAWLGGARSRLLRAAKIQTATSILELGCGWGQVACELAERSQATVIGLDINAQAIQFAKLHTPSHLQTRIQFTLGNASKLPLGDQSIDLVFGQCALLWMSDVRRVLEESHRVLRRGGKLVMIEPDFGGLMEWPQECQLRDIWLHVLPELGADPLIGRKLPHLLSCLDWQVQAYFLDRYELPSTQHIRFLQELPLSAQEHNRLNSIENNIQQQHEQPHKFIAHLPYWMIIATRQQ